MQSRLKLFDRQKKSCNPYKEFWEFLEWLGKHRQYPPPMYIWDAMKFSQGVSGSKPTPMTFPAHPVHSRIKTIYRFPAADESRSRNVCRK